MLAFFAPDLTYAADAKHGEKVFKKCKACHSLTDDGKRKTGPHLEHIIGRAAASVEGFKYSKSMLVAASDGLMWTHDELSRFLTKPRDMIAKSKMSFAGLKKESDRDDLIAFLKTLGTADPSVHDAADPEVSAEILALEGDVEYGEYLSANCVTCHQADGSDQGLPSIVGWPGEAFVTVMHSYKSKYRENPVMQQQAGALSDDEIAALAAYFESANQ